MNSDTIGGNWEEIKGKIKATWGKITDDDLTVVEGKTQEMIGKLQKAYGYSKEQAEEEWKRFSDNEENGCCKSKDTKGSSCCN